MKSTLPEMLCRLRRDKNISQRQAAEELGVSQALLSHYEKGVREPKLDFIIRACDYYGVSMDVIVGREELPEKLADDPEELRAMNRILGGYRERDESAARSVRRIDLEAALDVVSVLLSRNPQDVEAETLRLVEGFTLREKAKVLTELEARPDGMKTDGSVSVRAFAVLKALNEIDKK